MTYYEKVKELFSVDEYPFIYFHQKLVAGCPRCYFLNADELCETGGLLDCSKCWNTEYKNEACSLKTLWEREEKTETKDYLTELATKVHANAVEKGWYEDEPSFPQIIALCHSELSEALQEYRNNPHEPIYTETDEGRSKPSGVYYEMVDCLLRILDYFGHQKVNVDALVKTKMEYNETRPYKHGGKYI